ncbi:MAG: hypothetical protein M3463_00195 [Verrucomicrobiota bacterium]|nr:hypothetical protein [Verrucomicrobiota bacterium]
MRRLTVLSVALAMLASLILSCGAALPVDWSNAVAWYDTLGFPDTKDLPYVRVATGSFYQVGDNSPENRFVEGFLVDKEPDAFTVFICGVSYFKDWPNDSEPYPALTTVRFLRKTAGPAHQHVSYEVLNFKDVLAEVLERVREQALKPDDGLRYGQRYGHGVTHRARIFALARACLQKNHSEPGLALMNFAANIADEQTGKRDPHMLRETLQRQIGDALLSKAEADFADPSISWAESLKGYEHFATRFPASLKLAYAQESAELLKIMIAEEATHQPKPLEQMSPAEQVAENIFQLRNLGHCRWIMYNRYPIHARTRAGEEVITPVHRLVDLGYEAVPQLIATLEDRRFTRSMVQTHKAHAEPKVMRVGDIAQRILEHMSGRNFYARKTEDGRFVDGTTRQQAESWWAEVQR